MVAAALAALAAVAIAHWAGGGPRPLPLPGVGRPRRAGDPFAYVPGRAGQLAARATAGSAHVLFTRSPGGAPATAARVAAWRPLIDRVTRGTGVDPNLLEGIVFVESAGRPDAMAASDPSAAAGLTQILAQTGQSLLRMNIDLGASRALTAAIDRAAAAGDRGRVRRLERRLARVDDRFDPRRALAATVRYLQFARARLGRADLAVVSYHMGVGNLAQVLDRYDGGAPAPYGQVYFDTAPDRHPAAYRLLSSFGDESSLYYWKVRAAGQIMATYRANRSALTRLSALQTATDSAAYALHPPDRSPTFSDPAALADAYAQHAVLPLPRNARALGLAYDPGMGSAANQLGVAPALYRGLRPAALDLLIELAARVRKLSGGAEPLTVAATVSDNRYQDQLGIHDPPAAGGWSFTLARRYVRRAQALALQAMLDRLQALDLIAWERFPSSLEVTVASERRTVYRRGPMNAMRTPDELLTGLPEFPFESKFREHDGLRLAHLDEGEGPPVVFFHGEPTWSFLWRQVIPPVLAAGYRCIAPDLAGFGRSDKPTDLEWYSYDRHSATIAALLEELDLREATVVVHDWGGPIGLRAAAEPPGPNRADGHPRHRAVHRSPANDRRVARVSRLRRAHRGPAGGILVRGACKRDPGDEVIAAYDAPFVNPESKAGARAFPLLIPTSPEMPGAAQGQRVLEALRGDPRPKLVLWGDSDPVLPLETGRRFAQALGTEVHHVLAEASHFLQEDAGPEIGALIADWLGS